jgi:hypothetical protein
VPCTQTATYVTYAVIYSRSVHSGRARACNRKNYTAPPPRTVLPELRQGCPSPIHRRHVRNCVHAYRPAAPFSQNKSAPQTTTRRSPLILHIRPSLHITRHDDDAGLRWRLARLRRTAHAHRATPSTSSLARRNRPGLVARSCRSHGRHGVA